MSLPLFLQGFGSIGVFASRAFLPAFVTALMLRFGPQFPWLAQTGLLPHVRDVPTWFTSNATLLALGLLAAMEFGAGRSPEARAFLDEVHGYLKAGMAALTYLGVLGAHDRAIVGRVLQQAGMGDALPVLAVATATFLAARVRSGLVAPFVDADEDDDVGLQRLLRWGGDLWGTLGPVALIIFPVLTVAVFGIALLFVGPIERRIDALGDGTKVACVRCGASIHPSAPSCPSCRAPVEVPRGIGLLGRPRQTQADLASLPYRLFAVGRCPACATRYKRRAVEPCCGACGFRPMDDPSFVRAYIATIDRRVALTCAFGFGLGLIPVLGVVLGVIAYRLALVAPFRRYLPTGRRLLLRWSLRLAVIALVAFQWVPVAGAFALPLMALINYGAYRTAYKYETTRA